MQDYIEHEKELEVAVQIAETIVLKDNLRLNCSRSLRELKIQKDAPTSTTSTSIGKRKGEREGWEGRQPKSDHRKGERDGREGRQSKSKRNHQ